MASRPIRLQDLVAGFLAVAFAVGLVATVWHLASRYSEIGERAAEARRRFGELAEQAATGFPQMVTALEMQIDTRLRDRRVQEDRSKTAGDNLDRTAREQEKLRREALEKELTGLGPFDAGPAPDTWGPRIFHAKWWKWRAKKKVVEALNKQYHRHETKVVALKSAILDAKRLIAAIDADIKRLRDLKNTTQEILRDPRQREELAAAIQQSTGAQVVLFLLHVPIAIYFLILCVRAWFRLAILREWLGSKRLCRAH
jgi:septal ring factor EnvC (AmiA/AmiB activator)